ncbi:IS3 family transposase [Gilliamella sp. GillExp13]|uniref:IS3 family transposase n=1 Tax=Gilliamella sp. GillExp13 TaxID=3120243 RepID=UPI00080E33A8|nr:IS3 family transposase [Gilliamella apicola]OCG61410.1 hypothetical protein A9G37_02240 [Gilliamella apicola]
MAGYSKYTCKKYCIHTEKSNESPVGNELIGIKRSLSRKGCPYGNAIAESTFKAVKTEFVSNTIFDSLAQLKLEFNHYVDWFNYNRLHSTLNYQSLIEYKRNR